MVKKLFWLGSAATLALSLAACSEASSNEDVPKSHTEEHSTETAAVKPEQEEAGEPESEAEAEESVIDDEQKGMAIETLKEIVKNAKSGIVYRFLMDLK